MFTLNTWVQYFRCDGPRGMETRGPKNRRKVESFRKEMHGQVQGFQGMQFIY